MLNDIKTSAKNFYVQPFTTNMSALGWFAFVGLLIMISAMWGLLLNHFKIGG